MRWRYLLIATSLSLMPGCLLTYYIANNLINEPTQAIHNAEICLKTRKLGKSAYKEFIAQHPEWAESDDFEDGFVDGFGDYLDRGGNGSPPAVPPKKYQRNKYFNPEGYQAIDRYFAGFVAGTRTAQESGLRDTLIVPILVPLESNQSQFGGPVFKESTSDPMSEQIPNAKKQDETDPTSILNPPRILK
jgi:hypothetical protein